MCVFQLMTHTLNPQDRREVKRSRGGHSSQPRNRRYTTMRSPIYYVNTLAAIVISREATVKMSASCFLLPSSPSIAAPLPPPVPHTHLARSPPPTVKPETPSDQVHNTTLPQLKQFTNF